MANMWSFLGAELFWEQRACHMLFREDNIETIRQAMIDQNNVRDNRQDSKRQKFFDDNDQRLVEVYSTVVRNRQTDSANLRFWCENSSWTFCSKCNTVSREKLFQRFAKRPVTKNAKTCACSEQRYIVPLFSIVPEVLRNLSLREVCALRPFDLHSGDYVKQEHGYRQKTAMSRLSVSTSSVQEKIAALQDKNTRKRCREAYNFLITCEASSYRHFIEKRENLLREGKRINMYDLTNVEGIECCLWPNLYPFTTWCESILKGNQSRLSRKVSFLTKVFSEIVDYSMNFELLQFHYDMWIFTTVSGALSTARKMNCLPIRALNAKTFSSGYWKDQHRLLLDAVDQFGYPTVFVTISPYEWTFPFPKWLQAIRTITARGPCNLAGLETIHIAHVLEQVVRGYLCGSNDTRWNQHIFNYYNLHDRDNINTYFYRFEFQGRGTVHLHLLVWLKNIKQIQHSFIRADVPWEDPDVAFDVHNLQPANTGSLPLNNEQTTFSESDGKQIMHVYHPEEAFSQNLRGYISTVLSALTCRMDFQLTDGKAMILRYVTSYVSKWHDAYDNDALYSPHVTPFQAAYRHLKELKPCEPEMWLFLSSMKMSWSKSRTKDFVVPISSQASTNKTYLKYLKRATEHDDLSFLQWLRVVNHTPLTPKAYGRGNTLVGLRMRSPFSDEYFFQELVTNYPHRQEREIYHSRDEQLPARIRFFAAAVDLMPQLWNEVDAVKVRFERQGHKHFYVNNLLAHIESLHDTLHMWRKQIFTTQQLSSSDNARTSVYNLDPFQNSIFHHVMACLSQRRGFYTMTDEQCFYLDDDDDDDQHDHDNDDDVRHNVETGINTTPSTDWRKFTLLTGKPGTGKSHILLALIEKCISDDGNVLIATPTGYLASYYAELFEPNVTADTVHSAFLFPVNDNEPPTINWNIANFDLVILDEISMIPERIARHVIETIAQLTVRPIVVLAGDNQQQQPIETICHKVTEVKSILRDNSFYTLVDHFNLTRQYRCMDPQYETFLNHIRYWPATQSLLDSMQEGKVICSTTQPTDTELVNVILQNIDATMLTVSKRAACHVNDLVIKSIFAEDHPLTTVQCDCEMPPIPLFKNMRVMITQNRDKANGVVNGKKAKVLCVQKATIFLELGNGKVVNTYPVSIETNDGRRSCYPFMPAYALTITKSQGQNLQKVLIWFDCETVPRGSAYVALSRIQRQSDLILITKILSRHCQPVLNN